MEVSFAQLTTIFKDSDYYVEHFLGNTGFLFPHPFLVRNSECGEEILAAGIVISSTVKPMSQMSSPQDWDDGRYVVLAISGYTDVINDLSKIMETKSAKILADGHLMALSPELFVQAKNNVFVALQYDDATHEFVQYTNEGL